jgi:hypothetical protein
MKRSLIVSVCCLSALLLVSFANKKPKVTKIGETLYKAKGLTAAEPADQRTIKELITKYYGLKDFSTKEKVEMLSAAGTRGGYVFEKSILVDYIHEKVYKFNNTSSLARADEEALVKVLTKYED